MEDVSLTQLPDRLGRLTQLTVLRLARNSLDWLPPCFSLLASLTFCDLSSNQLFLLPSDLPSLPHLTHLLAASNRIGELPANMADCPSLVTLDLYSNQLASLPALASLPLLRCDLSGNLLCLEMVEDSLGGAYLGLQKELRIWEGGKIGEWGVEARDLKERGTGFHSIVLVKVERRTLGELGDSNLYDSPEEDGGDEDYEKPLSIESSREDSYVSESDDENWECDSTSKGGEATQLAVSHSWWRWGVGRFCPADLHPRAINLGMETEWEAWRQRRQPGPRVVARQEVVGRRGRDGQFGDVG